MLTHVLVECPELIASVRVGVLEPLKPLQDQGKCEVRFLQTKDIKSTDVEWCDVLISVRGCETPSLRLIQSAKKAGRYIVYFLDDDLMNVPTQSGSSVYFSDNSIQRNLKEMLCLSDCLWVVNPRVGEKYSQFCSNWFYSPVALDVEKIRLQQKANSRDKVRVLYAGSADHEYVIKKYLVPAIKNVNKQFHDKVEFIFLGADPDAPDVENVKYYPFFSDYEEYVTFVQNGGFVLGLAPVMDSEFHKCKYYNKFVEYTTHGLAGIYSDLEPYRGIVQHDETGYLCDNTIEAWTTEIINAINHPDEVVKIQNRAVDFLRDYLNPEKVAQGIAERLPQIISYRPLQCEAIRIPNMKALFYRERLRFLWRTQGFRVAYLVPQKVWKKMRMNIRNGIKK